MKLFKRVTSPGRISFDERTGSICDAVCRAAGVRERAIDRGLAGRYGVR
jgi:hypothetical protein